MEDTKFLIELMDKNTFKIVIKYDEQNSYSMKFNLNDEELLDFDFLIPEINDKFSGNYSEDEDFKLRTKLFNEKITKFYVIDEYNLLKGNKDKEKNFFIFILIHFLVSFISDGEYCIDECIYRVENEIIMYYKKLRIEILMLLLESNSENIKIWNENFCFNEEFQPLITSIIDEWISICSNHNDMKINRFFLANKGKPIGVSFLENQNNNNDNKFNFPFTRKEGMDSILFNKKDFRSNSSKVIEGISAKLINNIMNWYLQVYDVKRAREIGGKIIENYGFLFRILFLVSKWCYRIQGILLVLIYFSGLIYIVNDGSNGVINFLIKYYYYAFDVIIIYMTIYIILTVFVFSKKLRFYNLMIPRLPAAIIIGYIPLIWSDELVKFFMNIGFEKIVILTVVSFLAIIIYLYIEVSNIVDFEEYNWRKVLYLFFQGILYSMIIGFFLLNFFTLDNNSINSEMQKELFLINGNFSLKLFVSYISVSMVLGLLLQILWEDKSITHPL
jgi:hypothetical protein